MKAPVKTLSKANIEWLSEHTCKAHRVDYLSHYNCYLREKPDDSPFAERVGFLDIESTGLKGNWDFMLCYCIKELDGPILGRRLTQGEIRNYKFDHDLTQELIENVLKFNRVITYYGSRFDLPFIKTRAEKWGLDFPAYRELWQTDCYDIAKRNLLLHSTRLEQVCKLMSIDSKGHRLEPDIWQMAQAGHEESLEWIFTHCQEDVTSLEGAWKRLKKYTMPQKRSI